MIFTFLIASLALAQSQCNEAQNKAQGNCAQAIQMASASGSSAAPGSLSQTAQQDADGMRAGANAMTAASQYCQDMRKRCKEICNSNSPGSQGSPNEQREIGQLTCVGGNCDANGRPTGPIVPCKEGSSRCSPLVIQLGEQALRMAPPEHGVWFDILGANAPVPYAPIQISWPDKESLKDNYFLTLPKKSALVLGIDELFGNNTAGPDPSRPFAENGFEALKKFDQSSDGYIDEQDQVFSQLRLWRDLNGNGRAEFNELHSLAELSVAKIDLNYDPTFRESDRFGNEIKTKSVVELADGSLKMIFDLWFVSAR